MKLPATYLLMLGGFFLFLAVALGAFGAHGLEAALSTKAMNTFQTGIRYHFYHGFALILLGIIQFQIKSISFEKIALCFTMGILFFSFNCYIYAITGIKIFAMIVPLGGVLFLLGWLIFVITIYRSQK